MTINKHKCRPAGVGMRPSQTRLGSFIRARRLKLGLKQVQLTKRAGLARDLVSMIEIGRTRRYLSHQQLERFARTLQCRTEELRKRMPEKRTAQPTTKLGKMIRSRREELGLTLAVFAKKLGITPRQARRLEIRKNPSLRYNLVRPLSRALKLDPLVFGEFLGHIAKATDSELGLLIRRRRKELTLNLAALAKKLRVSKQFVNQIEFGQCRMSKSDELLERLAKVLKLNLSELRAVQPRRKLKQITTSTPHLS